MEQTATLVLFAVLLLLALLFIVRAVVVFVRTIASDGPSRAAATAIKQVAIGLFVALYIAYGLLALVTLNISGAVRGIFESVYGIMLSIGIQTPTSELIGNVGTMLDKALGDSPLMAGLLTDAYAAVLIVLCQAAPLLTIATAVRYMLYFLRKCRLYLTRSRHSEAILFSGLSDVESLIALDIFDTFYNASAVGAKSGEGDRGGRPLVLFCGVGPSQREEHAELIETLEERGKGHVLFMTSGLVGTLEMLEQDWRLLFKVFRYRFDHIRIMVLGDDYSQNVRKAIRVLDKITDMCVTAQNASQATSAKRARSSGKGAVADAVAHAEARRYSVYCMHDNNENELVFDSLTHVPSDATGADMEEYPTERELEVRRRIEVRLVSRAREQAFELLTRHPLYDVLDRPSYGADEVLRTHGGQRDLDLDLRRFERKFAEAKSEQPEQQLYVVVVGLGAYGMEVLKTAYWIGRMRGVSLHILGVDQRGDTIGEWLESTCPEMMDEGTIRIIDAQVYSRDLRGVLEELPKDARLYTVVTLGNDELNLNVALYMRRLFDEMIRRGTLEDRAPFILPLVNSKEVFEAADRLVTDRSESLKLEPFGLTSDVFSYDRIVHDPWETYALGMCAAYREVWDGGLSGVKGVSARVSEEETRVEYAEYEIKKLSNRANVRHAPYRLWCLGIDPHELFDQDGRFREEMSCLSNDRWLALLGVVRHENEGTDAQSERASEVLAGVRFDTPASRTGRIEGADEGQKERERRLRKGREDLQQSYPVLSALGDLEHDRWMAFYRSQGWRDLTPKDCDELKDAGIIEDKATAHQSSRLRLHGYLCPTDELVERGAAFYDDPFVYDRAAVLEMVRILSHGILSK